MIAGRASVAAHSPATADVGLGVLADGGTAGDAAVAMTLAACVVEPFVTSLLSGIHALHMDSSARAVAIDGFVDIPANTTGGRRVESGIDFGSAHVPYTIGGATFGVPGLVAGCGELHRRFGRLPWAAVVQPAIECAEEGFLLSRVDAMLLQMLEPVMTIGVGRQVYCQDGRLKGEGERVVLPGIDGVLRRLADQGAEVLYEGELAEELGAFCRDIGSLVRAEDLRAFTVGVHTPPAVSFGPGWVLRSRRGLSPLTDWVARVDQVQGPPTVRVAAAQSHTVPKVLGTTSLAASDATGDACAVTASLGLGTGDWFHGSQLNSMLGEVELLVGGVRPRHRMGSMMAPSALVDPDGAVTAIGSAGGSRIPSAMLRTIVAMAEQGDDPHQAVARPRIHRVGSAVHVEPGLPEGDIRALQAAGFSVEHWASRHHYFGGVSIAGALGAEGDPRRGGAARTLGP